MLSTLLRFLILTAVNLNVFKVVRANNRPNENVLHGEIENYKTAKFAYKKYRARNFKQ